MKTPKVELKTASRCSLAWLKNSSGRYSEEELRRLLERKFVRLYLLLTEDEVSGYALVWVFGNEAQLHWFEVFEPFRRKGLGKTFFGLLLEKIRGEGVRELHLEVSEKNKPALKVYNSYKPEVLGRRRNYYPDGSDAIFLLFRVG